MGTFRHLDERDRMQELELSGSSIDYITKEELMEALGNRKPDETIDLSHRRIRDMDLSGMDLSNIDFACTRFERVDLSGADMDHDNVSRCFFVDCPMRGVRLTNAEASDASFRELDMTGSDFSGTSFYYAAFDYARLDDVRTDERTKWFSDAVPKEGAFICWKVGANYRVIQLLVPAEAGRACATSEAGRAEYAKVLSITDIDRTTDYTWDTAMVDHDFMYEVGKYVYTDNGFTDYPWIEDAPGLHFFMDRDMAIAFGTGNY